VPVYHLYVVQVARRQRPGIQQALSDAGIATGIHYPLPVHLQPAFTGLGLRAGDLPVAEALAGSVLSLPMYPELLDSEVDLIAARLLEALRLSAG
jgi:dTDP-4-amino-4,6-dideoxygalactose transaminase